MPDPSDVAKHPRWWAEVVKVLNPATPQMTEAAYLAAEARLLDAASTAGHVVVGAYQRIPLESGEAFGYDGVIGYVQAAIA